MKDIVVYTAVSKGYDDLKAPPDPWRREADFVAFIEEPEQASGWLFRRLHDGFRDPCRNAKIHKILPHLFFPTAQYSLWIDGSVQIVADAMPRQLIDTHLAEYDLAVFQHRRRHCVYEEGEYCMARGLDSPEIIANQLARYREEGYPLNNGLAECTVLLRRHTAAMARFNEAWYREIQAHSRRDQISFNYVARKLGFGFAFLPGNIAVNPHFKWLQNKATRSPVRQPT